MIHGIPHPTLPTSPLFYFKSMNKRTGSVASGPLLFYSLLQSSLPAHPSFSLMAPRAVGTTQSWGAIALSLMAPRAVGTTQSWGAIALSLMAPGACLCVFDEREREREREGTTDDCCITSVQTPPNCTHQANQH